MATEITFHAFGDPAPQGSKSAFVRGGRAVVVDGSSTTGRQKHAIWRASVAQAAMVARNGVTFDGAVGVEISFYFALPKSDALRSRHTTSPDIDKLVRSVLDSLTNSAMIRDDSLVCELVARKSYARDSRALGAVITVRDLSGDERADRDALKAMNRAKSRA